MLKTTHRHVAFGLLALAMATPAIAQDAIVPDQFSTIGAAVVGATDGNADGTIEILVRAGTYAENVLIRRSDVRLRGEDRATTIVRGNGIADTIRAENTFGVEILNLTLTGGGTAGDGIEFSRVPGGRVENCVLTGNLRGLSLNRSPGCVVTGCLVDANAGTGIKVNQDSDGTIVTNNTITGNANHGIDAIFSDGVTISGNQSNDNLGNGLRLGGGTSSTITSNQFNRNSSNGVRTGRASGNVFLNNVCDANLSNGFRIEETSGFTISGNSFINNRNFGIRRRDWSGDDWDGGQTGIQDPVGANVATGNRSGPLRSDN